jgi:ABC-type uncharacterized transport system substrate-binding protein
MRVLTALAMGVAVAISSHADVKGKKVLYLDSYHAGYVWSDGIAEGIQQTLAGTGVQLQIEHMDTKRKPDDASVQAAVAAVKEAIATFKPDIVIASDDNAAKLVIKPFYKDAALPFVFCGVNWDASVYDFPYKNVTGMEEVDGAKELVDLLKQVAKGERIALLTDDTETSHANAKNYQTKLGLVLTPVFVKNLAEWEQKFTELQSSADILLIGNISGIPDFDSKAAESHALKDAKIPSGAVQVDMMPYAMVGYLKVAKEQGVWSAKTALAILNGKSPKSIPMAQNKEGEVVVNLKVASAANIEIPYTIVEVASRVIQ